MQLALPFWARAAKDSARTAPNRTRHRAPVFIGDAVVPWRGETLLLALLREQALRELDPEGDQSWDE
jgi:hypothetical protein